jgi:hypothetical protein
MVNKKNLEKALLEWKQEQLEKGKFPCHCGHFESSHVKRMCISCHGEETKENGDDDTSCWHSYKSMDNLTLIEWMAKHKEELE